LTIGGTSFTPESVSNTEIVLPIIIFDTLNSRDLVINYNGKSVTYTLFPDAEIEVAYLEYSNKGPTFKGAFTITGKYFGTDKSKLEVTLY